MRQKGEKNEPHIFGCITDEYCRGMDDPCRNGAQTLAETGAEMGKSCAVGTCGTAAGVPFCAGEPVQSDAEAADIVGLFVRKYDRQSGRKCVRADTLQTGTNFSNNISQAALDGSMGAAGSGMGGVFGITGSGIRAFGTGVWRIPERLLSAFSILWLTGVILLQVMRYTVTSGCGGR